MPCPVPGSIVRTLGAARALGVIAACVSLATAIGCAPLAQLGPLLVPLSPVGELPLEPEGAAFVERHKEGFTVDPNNALSRLGAPAVRDDLTQLDGCWGAFQVYGEADGGLWIASQARFVQVDVEQGTLTVQVISRGGPLADVDVAVDNLYLFGITGPDEITVTPAGSAFASTLFPAASTFEPDAETSQQETTTVKVTVQGNLLRFWGEGEGSFDSHFVYVRMDTCP